MTQFHIWMEGFAVTGQQQGAQRITIKPIEAETFDDAVKEYMRTMNKHGIEENGRGRYVSDEAYAERRSHWNIWACNLYPTEEEARKSFG